jgi:hypothetical protein
MRNKGHVAQMETKQKKHAGFRQVNLDNFEGLVIDEGLI